MIVAVLYNISKETYSMIAVLTLYFLGKAMQTLIDKPMSKPIWCLVWLYPCNICWWLIQGVIYYHSSCAGWSPLDKIQTKFFHCLIRQTDKCNAPIKHSDLCDSDTTNYYYLSLGWISISKPYKNMKIIDILYRYDRLESWKRQEVHITIKDDFKLR